MDDNGWLSDTENKLNRWATLTDDKLKKMKFTENDVNIFNRNIKKQSIAKREAKIKKRSKKKEFRETKLDKNREILVKKISLKLNDNLEFTKVMNFISRLRRGNWLNSPKIKDTDDLCDVLLNLSTENLRLSADHAQQFKKIVEDFKKYNAVTQLFYSIGIYDDHINNMKEESFLDLADYYYTLICNQQQLEQVTKAFKWKDEQVKLFKQKVTEQAYIKIRGELLTDWDVSPGAIKRLNNIIEDKWSTFTDKELLSYGFTKRTIKRFNDVIPKIEELQELCIDPEQIGDLCEINCVLDDDWILLFEDKTLGLIIQETKQIIIQNDDEEEKEEKKDSYNSGDMYGAPAKDGYNGGDMYGGPKKPKQTIAEEMKRILDEKGKEYLLRRWLITDDDRKKIEQKLEELEETDYSIVNRDELLEIGLDEKQIEIFLDRIPKVEQLQEWHIPNKNILLMNENGWLEGDKWSVLTKQELEKMDFTDYHIETFLEKMENEELNKHQIKKTEQIISASKQLKKWGIGQTQIDNMVEEEYLSQDKTLTDWSRIPITELEEMEFKQIHIELFKNGIAETLKLENDAKHKSKKQSAIQRLKAIYIPQHLIESMEEAGWLDENNWNGISKKHLRSLGFQDGHCELFFNALKEKQTIKRKSNDSRTATTPEEILREWDIPLILVDRLKAEGWAHSEYWDDLLAGGDYELEDLGFKPGHISTFKRKFQHWKEEQDNMQTERKIQLLRKLEKKSMKPPSLLKRNIEVNNGSSELIRVKIVSERKYDSFTSANDSKSEQQSKERQRQKAQQSANKRSTDEQTDTENSSHTITNKEIGGNLSVVAGPTPATVGGGFSYKNSNDASTNNKASNKLSEARENQQSSNNNKVDRSSGGSASASGATSQHQWDKINAGFTEIMGGEAISFPVQISDPNQVVYMTIHIPSMDKFLCQNTQIDENYVEIAEKHVSASTASNEDDGKMLKEQGIKEFKAFIEKNEMNEYYDKFVDEGIYSIDDLEEIDEPTLEHYIEINDPEIRTKFLQQCKNKMKQMIKEKNKAKYEDNKTFDDFLQFTKLNEKYRAKFKEHEFDDMDLLYLITDEVLYKDIGIHSIIIRSMFLEHCKKQINIQQKKQKIICWKPKVKPYVEIKTEEKKNDWPSYMLDYERFKQYSDNDSDDDEKNAVSKFFEIDGYKLLKKWRLERFHERMVNEGWENPLDWIHLDDHVMKQNLGFRAGHIQIFNRKFDLWVKKYNEVRRTIKPKRKGKDGTLIVASEETKYLRPSYRYVFTKVIIRENGTLTTTPWSSSNLNGGVLFIESYQEIVLEKGARISVNGRGYWGSKLANKKGYSPPRSFGGGGSTGIANFGAGGAGGSRRGKSGGETPNARRNNKRFEEYDMRTKTRKNIVTTASDEYGQDADDDLAVGAGGRVYGNRELSYLISLTKDDFDEDHLIKENKRPHRALGSGGGCYYHDTGNRKEARTSIRGGSGGGAIKIICDTLVLYEGSKIQANGKWETKEIETNKEKCDQKTGKKEIVRESVTYNSGGGSGGSIVIQIKSDLQPRNSSIEAKDIHIEAKGGGHDLKPKMDKEKQEFKAWQDEINAWMKDKKEWQQNPDKWEKENKDDDEKMQIDWNEKFKVFPGKKEWKGEFEEYIKWNSFGFGSVGRIRLDYHTPTDICRDSITPKPYIGDAYNEQKNKKKRTKKTTLKERLKRNKENKMFTNVVQNKSVKDNNDGADNESEIGGDNESESGDAVHGPVNGPANRPVYGPVNGPANRPVYGPVNGPANRHVGKINPNRGAFLNISNFLKKQKNDKKKSNNNIVEEEDVLLSIKNSDPAGGDMELTKLKV